MTMVNPKGTESWITHKKKEEGSSFEEARKRYIAWVPEMSRESWVSQGA